MFRIDHHLHTTWHSPDSIMEPRTLVERARAVGLHGVVITEHDRLWSQSELEHLRAEADGLLVLAGVEVSALEGHFLVYGLEHLDDVFAGIPLARLLEVVKRAGAAIVAAHPFRWGQDFDEIAAAHGPVFDGIEFVSNNVTHQTRALAEALLERWPMPATGSSDAHDSDVVGCYFTEFPRPIRDMSEFVAALKAGNFRPGYRPGARLASGPVGNTARSKTAVGGR